MIPSNRKTKRQKNKGSNTNPADSVIVYNGPVKAPRAAAERATISTYVSWAPTTLVTSAGGVINTVYSDDISTANDYASLAAVWDEYRVLAMEIRYCPITRYTGTLNPLFPGFVLIDRDDATAIASASLAANYESADLVMLTDPWKKVVKMGGVEDAQFTTTATPVARSWIKLRFDNSTVSASVGVVHQFALVQFRGRD